MPILARKYQGVKASMRRLSELKTGEKGVIARLTGTGRFRQRLMEMGFVPGTEILVEKLAPLRDPIEYVLKGYHVSLRHVEAEKVMVRESERE
jgi:Fe2+ transport system protein FeoA